MSGLSIDDIEQARERISRVARKTPLDRARWMENKSRAIWLKLECFQNTGAFKIRGAMSKLSRLSGEEKSKGVLTVSAGNHGLAVAHCAEALQLEATIVVPQSASRAKVDAIRRYQVSLIERG